MYRVMIVEDDMLYRHEIRNFINWEKYGFTIVGEAINGDHALRLMEELKPDLILTDISMPGMNGIELIKILRREYPLIKFFVLSSYDDFKFVKDAMKLGAEDYILKYEIKEEDFINLLIQMKKKLQSEEEERSREVFLEENKYRIAHDYIRGMINGQEIDVQQLAENLRILNMKEQLTNLAVLGIKIFPSKEDRVIDFMNGDEIAGGSDSILLKVSEYEYAVIVFFDKERSEMKIHEYIHQIEKLYINALEEHKAEAFTIGVSNVVPNWNYLKKAYEQAVHAAGRSFYEGLKKTYYYSDICIKASVLDEREYYQKFLENLEEGRMETAIKAIHEFFGHAEACDFSASRIQEELYRHLNIIYKAAVEEKIDFERISGSSSINPRLLDKMQTRSEAEGLLRDYILTLKNIMGQAMEIENSTHKKEVKWMKEYIDKNYMNEINLTVLSEELNFTPNYICRIFKKSTGMRITEYLNQIRVEHTKRLIKTTNLKVYEIAEMVGFSSVSYFCKVFKDVTGTKVSEYKEKL